MAGSGENYSVPDLHCFEDLADFELETKNHLYDDLTSTKDISTNLNSDSNSQCGVCSSSLCTDGQSEDNSWSVWDPNGSVSYHDIWCDDSSWKFTPSSEEEYSQATQSSTSTSASSFHSTVQQDDVVVEDAHHQAVSSNESPQVTAEAQNVPTESMDEMSDEDIFAVNPSMTPRPGPNRFDDIEVTDEAQNVPTESVDEMSDEDIFAVNHSTTPRPGPNRFDDIEVTDEAQNVPTESVDEMSDEDIFAVNPSTTPRPGPNRFDDIEVTDEAQNVPTESVEEMSDEDIFAVNPSTTPRPSPYRFDDIEDFAWWELSQMSSQSSQSSAIANETEDSHLVPTLHTILQHHRHSAGDQVAASVDLDDTSDNEERQRNELLFNSSCAAAEQVVPNWHTEE